jgi:hypothetical protein
MNSMLRRGANYINSGLKAFWERMAKAMGAIAIWIKYE